MRRKVPMAKVRAELISGLTCRPDSARHVLKLGDIERLRPCEAALSEHLKHRLDRLRLIQATERDEDRPRKALQVTCEDPRAAIRAEIPIQPLARLRDVMKCLWLAADECEIILRDAEKSSRLAACRLLAVQAVADGDEGRIGIELELDRAAGALSRIFLCHKSTFPSRELDDRASLEIG